MGTLLSRLLSLVLLALPPQSVGVSVAPGHKRLLEGGRFMFVLVRRFTGIKDRGVGENNSAEEGREMSCGGNRGECNSRRTDVLLCNGRSSPTIRRIGIPRSHRDMYHQYLHCKCAYCVLRQPEKDPTKLVAFILSIYTRPCLSLLVSHDAHLTRAVPNLHQKQRHFKPN